VLFTAANPKILQSKSILEADMAAPVRKAFKLYKTNVA
jgi:hypothetical protein